MRFTFHTTDTIEWLRSISLLRDADPADGMLTLDFNSIPRFSLQPDNIASLACLMEELTRRGVCVSIDLDSPAGVSLWNDYRIGTYWGSGVNYTPASEERILNLWRIDEAEKDLHGKRIENYLRKRFFQNKDLTAVSLSLAEAYYNVFDHAQADGNAFSMLSLDLTTGVLRAAVCDFGIGIARSVQGFLQSPITDPDALLKAVEVSFSVKSTAHNAGFGLANIKDACSADDTLRITSNCADLRIIGDNSKSLLLDFDFRGTLLAYELSLAQYDNLDQEDYLVW